MGSRNDNAYNGLKGRDPKQNQRNNANKCEGWYQVVSNKGKGRKGFINEKRKDLTRLE